MIKWAMTVFLVASAMVLSAQQPQSVWDGIFTEAQARRGDQLYAQYCAHCHAADLTGGEMAPPLTGGQFKYNWNGLTVGDLFERLRISMPQDNPGGLSRQQNADVLAFMLAKSDFPAGDTELASQTEVLKEIKFEADRP
ncbi:MAG TPA: c-type cytochrome [Vicinamibacterales bacterium]|jgi:mono/diheme cytochrome c family protein